MTYQVQARLKAPGTRDGTQVFSLYEFGRPFRPQVESMNFTCESKAWKEVPQSRGEEVFEARGQLEVKFHSADAGNDRGGEIEEVSKEGRCEY